MPDRERQGDSGNDDQGHEGNGKESRNNGFGMGARTVSPEAVPFCLCVGISLKCRNSGPGRRAVYRVYLIGGLQEELSKRRAEFFVWMAHGASSFFNFASALWMMLRTVPGRHWRISAISDSGRSR